MKIEVRVVSINGVSKLLVLNQSNNHQEQAVTAQASAVGREELGFINELFEDEHEVGEFRVYFEVFFYQFNRFKAFVLFVLERDINIFEVVFLLTGGFDDGYGGFIKVVDFLYELTHLIQLITNTLKNLMHSSLLRFVIKFVEVLLGDNHDINIRQVQVEISRKRTKYINLYDLDSLFKSPLNLIEQLIVSCLLIFVVFLDGFRQCDYFFPQVKF